MSSKRINKFCVFILFYKNFNYKFLLFTEQLSLIYSNIVKSKTNKEFNNMISNYTN